MAPAARTQSEAQEQVITVLVTGFGPFQQRYPVNPSYEIAKSLPQLLPRSAKDCEAVQIITYNSPIRVAYRDAREILPPLLDAHEGTVNLVLHIGMASGRDYYAAERYAHRDGYDKHKDIDGETPPPGEAETLFAGCPERLETSLNFDRVLKAWKRTISLTPENSPAHGADCRASEDAGHFLCDYTYYTSMAWFGKRSGNLEGGSSSDRPVMFLHVPPESDAASLDHGQAVAVALIKAMVDDFVGVQE